MRHDIYVKSSNTANFLAMSFMTGDVHAYTFGDEELFRVSVDRRYGREDIIDILDRTDVDYVDVVTL